MALSYSHCVFEHREILLKDKPVDMLRISPKGTVPILVLNDTVLEESRDILLWALQRRDSQSWFYGLHADVQQNIIELIDFNDYKFKPWLDKYKYSVGYPEQTQAYYRAQCEVFLQSLEFRLQAGVYLLGQALTLADIAVFPFIRQFAYVDTHWFEQSDYSCLQRWLTGLLESRLFHSVMQKYKPWEMGDAAIIFPECRAE